MPQTINHLNFLCNQLRQSIEQLHAPIFFIQSEVDEQEELCEWCDGTGEVATDEDDGEGHLMRGVGTKKCICQYHV